MKQNTILDNAVISYVFHQLVVYIVSRFALYNCKNKQKLRCDIIFHNRRILYIKLIYKYALSFFFPQECWGLGWPNFPVSLSDR